LQTVEVNLLMVNVYVKRVIQVTTAKLDMLRMAHVTLKPILVFVIKAILASYAMNLNVENCNNNGICLEWKMLMLS
jgi:hypothetical protein